VARLRANPAVAEIVPDVQLTVLADGGPEIGGSQQTGTSQDRSAPLDRRLCPANPAKPFVEPEALADIHASSPNLGAPDEANAIATGQGVIVANQGANELAGNPNFQRSDGSHVVIDAPDYTVDNGNDETYGDVSSIGAQGTVVYDYSKELPFSGLPADCTFVIKGDAPGASVVDLSQIDTPILLLSQVLAGIDQDVSVVHADVISDRRRRHRACQRATLQPAGTRRGRAGCGADHFHGPCRPGPAGRGHDLARPAKRQHPVVHAG
jgi:hypothetical protein